MSAVGITASSAHSVSAILQRKRRRFTSPSSRCWIKRRRKRWRSRLPSRPRKASPPGVRASLARQSIASLEARIGSTNDESTATSESSCNPAEGAMRAGDVALGLIVRLARAATSLAWRRRPDTTSSSSTDTRDLHRWRPIGHIAQAALGAAWRRWYGSEAATIPTYPCCWTMASPAIIVPDVNTAAEAKRAVRAAKYAPNRPSFGGWRGDGIRPCTSSAGRQHPHPERANAGGLHDRDAPAAWRTSMRSRLWMEWTCCTSVAAISLSRLAARRIR